MRKKAPCSVFRPVYADCGEIEYRCCATHDVKCSPRVTQRVTQLPYATVHLRTTTADRPLYQFSSVQFSRIVTLWRAKRRNIVGLSVYFPRKTS